MDKAHDVERGADDRLVVAVPEHRRHRDRPAAQGGQDAVLPCHVVGALRHRADRAAADHVLVRPGAHDVGHVGVAAAEDIDFEWAVERSDVPDERRQPVAIDERKQVVAHGAMPSFSAHSRQFSATSPRPTR